MTMLMQAREEKKLTQSLQLVEQYLERSYLDKLTSYEVMPISKELAQITVQKNIRLLEITKIVYDQKEDITEKLVSIFNAVGSLGSALTLVIDSDGQQVKLFIGVRSANAVAAKDSLEKSFKGNFPGTVLDNLMSNEIETCLNNILDSKTTQKNISSVTGIPALKEVDKKEYIQGLEKLIDSMRDEAFSAIFIAEPIATQESTRIRKGYEEMYTSLVPFQKTELTAGKNEGQSISQGISEGVTKTINDSLTKTQSYTNGSSEGTSESETDNYGLNIIKSTFRNLVGGKTAASKGTTVNYNTNQSSTDGSSTTTGTAHATTSNSTNNTTETAGTSSTMQVHLEDKSITAMLEKIDIQLDRLKRAEDLGLWHYGCYFIAEDEQTARVAATNYQAIIRGDNSAIEGSSINVWSSRHSETARISSYLSKLSHPVLQMSSAPERIQPLSAGALINSRELAIAYGLPRKSVNGIPVIQMANFGRNVHQLNAQSGHRTFDLGHIYYMGQPEATMVALDIDSLAKHTFITGSTGSGKSNTIYRMLDQLENQQVKFLVIEPAKGEYKAVFGGRADVHVFGTNPQYTPILKMNPFRFPPGIHVLEHIERLIEIFNACWEMSAAMPAILREAVERTYIEVGWDLNHSYHLDDNPIYPTLKQLVAVLPKVIETSGYSEEIKSNYIGALVTRVKSLTSGLFLNIFSDQEIDNTILFDQNCIVDLSRIGSAETKSLIMGILFMRLQEHRIVYTEGMNVSLKHVTVLEEAHHLLRKTSIGQSTEGANLQGKSVEMLTNAIAEMRTYGEGFIIADQSPNLLDASVIRNTNTKIIMRLPDGTDRAEVGASASLTEEQLNEISKLETGVAIVYQNNWLEPVLCKVQHFTNEKPFKIHDNRLAHIQHIRKKKTAFIEVLLFTYANPKREISTQVIDEALESLPYLDLEQSLMQSLQQELMSLRMSGQFKYWEKQSLHAVAPVVAAIINPLPLVYYAQNASEIAEFHTRLLKSLDMHVKCSNIKYSSLLIQCLLLAHLKQVPSFSVQYDEWFNYVAKREVF